MGYVALFSTRSITTIVSSDNNNYKGKIVMNYSSRFKLFKEAFPLSELTRTKWERIVHWVDSSKTLRVLDMHMFPDSLKTLAWEHSPVKSIIFCETHRKLEILSLNHTKIKVVELPRSIKHVRELYLNKLPLTTLGLGGSRRALEVLELYPTTGRNAVKVPNNLKSLRILHVGAVNGPVPLPKIAPALDFLKAEVNIGDSSMRIPTSYTHLKDITVTGKFGGVIIPKDVTTIETMELDSESTKFSFPNVNGIDEIRICTKTDVKLDIPEKWGDTLKVLHVEAPSSASIKLPPGLGNLMSLNVTMPKVKAMELPETACSLKEIITDVGNISVLGDLDKLIVLDVTGKSVKLAKGKTAVRLRHIAIDKDAKASLGFPKEMLELETLCVNPQRVRFKNINTPRLNWYLTKRWGNRELT